MQNIEIAWVFHEMADLLEIKGADFFKIRAYRNAAKIISRLEQPVQELVKSGGINKIPGIGKAIAAKIVEILTTGECKAHRDLLAEVPRGVLEIRLLPNIGPKKARLLFEELGINSLEVLEKATLERQVRKLPGMSAKTELEIVRNIQIIRNGSELTLLGLAREVGCELKEYLIAVSGVKMVEFGGSTRRWKETVADLDMVVGAEDTELVLDMLESHPRTTKLLERSENRIRFLTWWGVPVDVTVVPPDKFITFLHRNTGSKGHYRQLIELAQGKGIELSHKGLFAGNGSPIPLQGEKDIYNQLGLDYIPPELRENKGEIELAARGALPPLIEMKDIKGDLHLHTEWSDASATLEEMIKGAKDQGYSYMAVTDHSHSLKIANGLSYERLKMQCGVIAKLNRQEKDFTILTGVECDILSDGRLDHPDSVLAELDVVVASVHSNFKQDKKTMTERIISAIEHEHVDIIGHVSGRLLGRREGYQLDVDKVLEAAAKYNTVLEINSSPERLDLNEENARKAKELGVKVAINTDAHDLKRLSEMEYGVAVARRAWLSPDDVVNTLDVEDLLKTLK